MLKELLFSNDTTWYCETSHRVFHLATGTLFAGTDMLGHWTEILQRDDRISTVLERINIDIP